jgi:hypothetical protein
MVVRMHTPQLKAIDAWIEENDQSLSRPEAIRRLVTEGLARQKPVRLPRVATSSFFSRR